MMKILQLLHFQLLAVFLITGCVTSTDNGTLVRTDEVKKNFESAAVVPDHTYFYYGPQAQPDAIIAIHNNFTLRQNTKNLWVKVDITEKMLQDWNLLIDNNTRIKFPYRGARIMTPDGRQAGIWYSKHTNTIVNFPGENIIVVYTPSPTMERRQRTPFRGFE